MEKSASVRFKSRRQSSRADLNLLAESGAEAAERRPDFTDESSDSVLEDGVVDDVPSGIKLMYAANDGELVGIREILASGTDVNYRDADGRTPLHVAACQGYRDAVELLIQNGAEVDTKDRWGSTLTVRKFNGSNRFALTSNDCANDAKFCDYCLIVILEGLKADCDLLYVELKMHLISPFLVARCAL